MARAPFGHVSRNCVRCGKVGPRTMFDGGWAHSRCLEPDERKTAHHRLAELRKPASNPGETPSAAFIHRAGAVTPSDIGTAFGVRGDAKVRLDSLVVRPGSRRAGLADQALGRFAALADETGVTLTAEVWSREQGPDTIPPDVLAALFEQHGFTPTGIGHTMRREPRQA